MSQQHRNDLDREAQPDRADDTARPERIASSGVQDAGTHYPHRAAIEASFGQSIDARAHTGKVEACDGLGANAYATGDQVAFREQTPDLRVAAHEAAHTLQQRQGVQLKSKVGESGDGYEQEADAAADLAVRGESAAHLFTGATGSGRVVDGPVQLDPLKEGGGTGDVSASTGVVFDELDRAFDHAEIHAGVLYDKRSAGIDELLANLQEANSPSIGQQILSVLALAALAAGSEAIGVAVVAKLGATVVTELAKAAIQEFSSQTVQGVAGIVGGKIAEGAGTSASKGSFMAGQKDGLLSLKGNAQTGVADQKKEAKDRVRAADSTARDGVLTKETASAWAFGTAYKSQHDQGRTTQYLKSMASWMNAMSQASLGTNKKHGKNNLTGDATDLAGEVDNSPKENVGGGDGNGVVYISFGLRGDRPLRANHIFVRGISDAVRDRIKDVPLKDLDVPIVATGYLYDGFLDGLYVDNNELGLGRNEAGDVYMRGHGNARSRMRAVTGADSDMAAARIILDEDFGKVTLKDAYT